MRPYNGSRSPIQTAPETFTLRQLIRLIVTYSLIPLLLMAFGRDYTKRVPYRLFPLIY